MVGQESLMAYYRTNFNLMMHHDLDPEYFDRQTPWEKRIYLGMIERYVKEKNAEIQRQQQNAGMGKVQHPGDF